MTLLEAYRKAITYPISDLPKLYISRAGSDDRLFLKEDLIEGGICLVDSYSIGTDDYKLTLSIRDLMSDAWEVSVDGGDL